MSLVMLGKEGNGSAFLACTARTTNTVDIILNRQRELDQQKDTSVSLDAMYNQPKAHNERNLR